ncbi:MAG: CCA tRNA nucleotidyltransferase [Candidatus Omnitrophica bacterium]|nr:CCA tRNA nucleotidyltransferase [Candidatus Omnitrophota bacterium]
MFVKKIEKLPSNVKRVLKRSSVLSRKLDVAIYLVGGIVRDFILGRDNFDLDIVVEGDGLKFAHALGEHYKADFRKHHSFGTATVYFKGFKVDIATARRESYPHPGALPVITRSTLKEDLIRRDFSINAMALSLNRDDYGGLIDYYKGYTDLRDGIIRVLHDRSFTDDPTRIFRAIRFEQRFGFRMRRGTLKLLKSALAKGALKTVNEQRLRDELALMFEEEHPSRCVKRVQALIGWRFLNAQVRLSSKELALFRHLDETVRVYQKSFPHYPKVDRRALYFAGLLLPLDVKEVLTVSARFGLRKNERTVALAVGKAYRKIYRVCRGRIDPVRLYTVLSGYPLEVILFCYAYYYRNRTVKKNLLFYLDKLFGVSLKVRGRDLKKLGFGPERSYSKVFTKLLHKKIEKDFRSRREELKELKKLAKDHLRKK